MRDTGSKGLAGFSLPFINLPIASLSLESILVLE
jgi:hypothetical protein